jgi:hypothetical protein
MSAAMRASFEPLRSLIGCEFLASESASTDAGTADVVAVGPGLGRSAGVRALVSRLWRDAAVPVVVDADGLWALAADDGPAAPHAGPRILTPHAGEMLRLLGADPSSIHAGDRAMLEREAAARSDQLAADGAFDLMLKGEYYDRLTGFYSGGFGKVEARQPLRPYGAEVFGSYRASNGTFPSYEDEFYTNRLGEAKVGALFSLLRNRDIDARRFAIEDTRLAASQARLDVMLVQLNVQHEALRAYWRWVAAGEEIRVFEGLLEIAEARQIGLTREVNEGARARIALTENEQNLLRRRTLLEEAKRNFAVAANSLGFYLRGSGGQMIVPTREHLPDQARLKAVAATEQLAATPLSAAIQNRPELETFRLAITRATKSLVFAQAALTGRDGRTLMTAAAVYRILPS